jgi:hypothetical protein
VEETEGDTYCSEANGNCSSSKRGRGRNKLQLRAVETESIPQVFPFSLAHFACCQVMSSNCEDFSNVYCCNPQPGLVFRGQVHRLPEDGCLNVSMLESIVSLLGGIIRVVHTARRYYRLNGSVRPSDWLQEVGNDHPEPESSSNLVI